MDTTAFARITNNISRTHQNPGRAHTMEFKRLLTPWNWFKKEADQTAPYPQHSNGTLITHDPFVQLHQAMDQLFDHFFQGFPMSRFRMPEGRMMRDTVFPQLNIAETMKDYTITVEVPGVDEKDIELTVEDMTLTIRGEKRSEHESQDSQYHQMERSYGVFQRVLSLPTNANEDQITAKFNKGVLTVTIGKNPSTISGGRKISIS